MVGQRFAQYFEKLLSTRRRVRRNVLLQHAVESRERGAAGQGIAAESRAVMSGLKYVAGPSRGDAGADRHAVAQRLGQGHHVGQDALVLEREQFAAARHAALYFVEHQ